MRRLHQDPLKPVLAVDIGDGLQVGRAVSNQAVQGTVNGGFDDESCSGHVPPAVGLSATGVRSNAGEREPPRDASGRRRCYHRTGALGDAVGEVYGGRRHADHGP